MSEANELFFARDVAEIVTAGDFDLNDVDRQDLIFLLTAANLAIGPLHQRRNIDTYYQYAIENKRELLNLAREFDQAIERFNQTAGKKVDESLMNTMATRAEDKLGKNGKIPFLLREPRTHNDIKAGNRAFMDVDRYMENSELAEEDPEVLEKITKEGSWSRLHLDAKSPKHFLATFIVDLYPMMLTRTDKYGETDPDELVRALCENLDPKTELFKLIKEQWGFSEGEYSKEFVSKLKTKELFDKYSKDKTRMRQVFTVLYNLAGAEKEATNQPGGEHDWIRVGEEISKLVDEDPEAAFQFGLTITTLPKNDDEKVEWRYRYLRGDGLTLLSDSGLKNRVSEFINVDNIESKYLADAIESFVGLPGVESWTKEKAYSTPEFFAMVQALDLCLNLDQDGKNSSRLYNLAKGRLSDPFIWQKVKYYKGSADIGELFKNLERHRKEWPVFNGTIRDLQEKDLDALRPILATWVKDRDTGEPLPGEIEEDLQIMSDSVSGKNERMYFVAEDGDGGVIGVIGFKKPDDRMLKYCETNNPVELINAYVDSSKRKGQGGGVGTALVAKLEEEAIKMGKTEVVLNSGPRYEKTGWGFYDKLPGYVRVGIAKEYYGEDGDAPVWRKTL